MIEGLVPRLEAQQVHRKFVKTVSTSTVLMDLVEARKLLKRDETAHSYCGEEVTVITTTTISDAQLDLISWERELEIVESFGPNYHIPTDVATYLEQTPAERRDKAAQVMEGTVWMHDHLHNQNIPTEILPLVKGVTPAEREICYQTFDALGVKQCVFYGTQYLTGGAGLTELQEDVTAVAEELDRSIDIPILLIGLLSPLYLGRMPKRVVAASGLRWLREVEPRSATPDEMRQQYAVISKEVADALDVDANRTGTRAGIGRPTKER